MKLWLLRPVDGLDKKDNPWGPWYGKAFGFVVYAETEEEARTLAHNEAGDENRIKFLGGAIDKPQQPWLNAHYSTCVEQTANGDAEVVIVDFAIAQRLN